MKKDLMTANLVTGRQLRAARAFAGLTQQDLGGELGVNERVVRFWERKHDRPPTSTHNLRRIEEALQRRGVTCFTFASRRAYRLAYRSQRETTYDRALRRAFKLRAELGADGGIGDSVEKPKWMRWRTYDRKLEEIFAAEEAVDAHLLGFVQKLERRMR
jgi:transcriptional regulator with XRE-family HTH domain